MFISRVNHDSLAKLWEPRHSWTMRLPKVLALFGNDQWNPLISQKKHLHNYLSNTTSNPQITSSWLVSYVTEGALLPYNLANGLGGIQFSD
jgi:hypothetical protein